MLSTEPCPGESELRRFSDFQGGREAVPIMVGHLITLISRAGLSSGGHLNVPAQRQRLLHEGIRFRR